MVNFFHVLCFISEGVDIKLSNLTFVVATVDLGNELYFAYYLCSHNLLSLFVPTGVNYTERSLAQQQIFDFVALFHDFNAFRRDDIVFDASFLHFLSSDIL